jgi:hypothetical protein
MRLTGLMNLAWTTAIIAAAIILTAVLSTARLRAQAPVAPRSAGAPGAAVAPVWLSPTGLCADAAGQMIDSGIGLSRRGIRSE